MSDPMQQIRDRFNNRPQVEKLLMGMLASGNSAYDMIDQFLEHVRDPSTLTWADWVKSVDRDLDESEEDHKERLEMYEQAYEQLGESVNSVLAG